MMWNRQVPIHINDCVFGPIKLHWPLQLIIDTEQFQRLRKIKQTGPVFHVFPTAEHKRFSHSLAYVVLNPQPVVSMLAFDLGETLKTLFKDVSITGRDMLCLSIAGLIHDLGHGPFSHTFDGPFRKRVNGEWSHEELSFMMFEYMLEKNSHVKQVLDNFLCKEDYTFIQELINPPKPLVSNVGEWIPKGRAKNKSFLFDIISNVHSGLDVDKMEYFIRDSTLSKCAVSFNCDAKQRLLNNVRILYDEELGYLRIGYSAKCEPDIRCTHETRTQLYEKLYKHKTSLIFEEMYVRMLTIANDHLLFTSPDTGKKYKMSEAYKDMSVYTQLNDEIVLSSIILSEVPEMEAAKNILKQIDLRQQPKWIGQWNVGDESKIDEQKAKVKSFLAERGLTESKITILDASINQGLGSRVHPLMRSIFFDKQGGIYKLQFEPEQNSGLNAAGKSICFVYADYDSKENVRSKHESALKEFINNHIVSIARKTSSFHDANAP
ncbi:Deoxynucleoside triphosphate triphosphohydrolase SAMHD1 [Aphelenchoides besseyi]|nr:Deoxynucleoside triphosphate triphosphohydrolase SAMHD1 [Aphelenchoides besseyi]